MNLIPVVEAYLAKAHHALEVAWLRERGIRKMRATRNHG